MLCVELWYSVEKFSAGCSHSAVSLGNNIFPNWIIKSQVDHIRTAEMGPWIWNLLFPFLKYIFGICDWGLTFPFPFGIMKYKSQLDRWILSLYFSNFEKLKYFVEKCIAYNQILMFEEKLCTLIVDCYVWYWAGPNKQCGCVRGWRWPQSTHRVAIADFWHTFHHDGKISPGWRGWGYTPTPLSLCLPSSTKLLWMLQLRGQIHSPYFISTPTCTLWRWLSWLMFKC